MRELANSQCFPSNCICGGRNRRQIAVSSEPSQELDEWSVCSPDGALSAVARVTPDKVYIQRHDADGIAVAVFRDGEPVARVDFGSRRISQIEMESRFKVFAVYNLQFRRAYTVTYTSFSILRCRQHFP